MLKNNKHKISYIVLSCNVLPFGQKFSQIEVRWRTVIAFLLSLTNVLSL